MAIEQRAQLPTSISLTFKVIRLVNQLRRRLRLRVSTGDCYLGSKTCLGLEPKALKTIAKGLSGVGLLQNGQWHRHSDRVHKRRKSSRLRSSGWSGSVNPNTSAEEMQHVLKSMNGNINFPGNALSTLCSDDHVFLKQNETPNFDGLSLNETVSHIVLVDEALRVLHAARAQYDDQWLLAQGEVIGLELDENFIANYEHLLLRLESSLTEALSRRVIEALLEGSHTKKQRRLLEWFTEFPNNRHPLNTTMPWSIKPSLAVLWGVCWMFYDSPNYNETPRVPQDRFLNGGIRWDRPQPNDYFNLGVELTAPQLQRTRNSKRDVEGLRASVFERSEAQSLRSDHPQLSHSELRAFQEPIAEQVPASFFQPAIDIRPTYPYATSPDSPHVNPGIDYYNSPLVAYPSWSEQQYFDHSATLPHRSPSHLTGDTPSIRVTRTDEFAQPRQTEYTNFNIYRQQPQAPQLIDDNFSPTFTMFQQNETSPITQQIIRHERTISNTSTSNIPTPVSMSGHESLMSPGTDRRMSLASSRSHEPQRQSPEASSDDGNDPLSPGRRNHTYKRSEEPQRNQQGKMICKHGECTTLIFDRKCEWSKHMDKHDRPYKCNVKGCEKLQGFTYSGGLLRHEREVHKMHGGTKKSLFCPFGDCKRSSGSGFTRKENLHEHVRRVHRRTSTSSDLGNMIITRQDITDEQSDLPQGASSPYRRASIVSTQDDTYRRGHKRMISDVSISEADEDEHGLRVEVKRLRREIEEKDERLRQLEAAVTVLQQESRR